MANHLEGYAKPLKMPVWRGESLLGKSITVVAEQGFGDIIQYARFLPFLKVMGAKKVVLLQNGSLHLLFGQMDCIDQFTNMPEEGVATGRAGRRLRAPHAAARGHPGMAGRTCSAAVQIR
jgi:hypothetical protein